MKRTLLSQCVLLALASFAAQAGETPATPCQNGDTTQTCGLKEYKDGNFYQDPGVTDAVMANETATNIYMDGHREAGDTQTLTVSGTDMSGYYIQGSNGGTVNINVTDNAKVDMIETGSALKTTNTTINVNDSTLNGQNSDGTYERNKDYMMGAAIYLDPLDEGYHNVDISNGSALHGSIISAGQGAQTLSMSDSIMDNGGIYVGSDKSDTSLTLTNAIVDATNSQVAQNLDTLVETLSQYQPFQNINVDAFGDVAVAMYGTTQDTLALNNSTVTGDIGVINEKGQTNLSFTSNSVVNGNVTLDGNSTNTLLVDNSTINGDLNASQNSGDTTITLQNGANVDGNITTGTGNDTVVLVNDSHVTGNVTGGDGDDTLSMDAGSSVSGQISQFETVNTTSDNSITLDTINDSTTWNLQNGSTLTADTTGSNAEVNMSTDSRVNFGQITGSRNAVVVNDITASAINQQNIVLGTFTTTTATTTPQTAANAIFSNGQQQVENRSAAYNYNNDLSIVPADPAPQDLLTADSSQKWNIVFSSSRGELASDVQGLVAGLDAAEQAGHQVTDDIASHLDRLHFAGLTGTQQEGAQLWGDFLYQNGNFSNDVDYKSITQGAQGGVDWTAYLANGDSLTGGVALAWTRSRVEDTANGPDSFKDSVYGNYYSLYGGWQQALNGRQWGMFADASFSYGDMRYSLSAHNVTGDTSGMTEALHGSTDGSLYMAQARTGVNVLLPGETVLQPYAILGWDQTKANGFSDREVTFADSQVSSWNGGAGLRLTTTLTDLNKNVQIMPWVDARVQKEFSDDTDIQAADYHNTEGHNNSMGMFGAGVNATIAHNFSLNTGIYYGTGDVDNDASVQAGMSYSF
ncbi:autotransporter outer membrane beta-barrel domain-containing protein [Leclercia adecarboxylata]|uniref:autotransporter outer membrane beta-barrel domain-containing protein n=1 Tax=Leclercia adecarboxylata TaxID=83655 RepID=UPI00202A64FD|nr:autotransporter outer membrane beta-barrel domain-containing protein [Leclercia adecarboxylata]URN98631.1 autotransporter outer membrane beta-barrel domain-containing protein [Leclercia adecarboxylata]